MKRFVLLGIVILGLSGCVSEYPGGDPYPSVYGPPVVGVYNDRSFNRPYRPPYYRDYRHDRGPSRGPGYGHRRPPPPGFGRPPNHGRPYPSVNRPGPQPFQARNVSRPRTGEQPSIDARRAFGGNVVAPPANRPPPRRGPRPYIPPIAD